jgi:anthranilate phosphoribosyltransferase
VHGDVPGHPGLDEISISGPTHAWRVSGNCIETYRWTPSDFGVALAPLDALRGGDAAVNAQIARAILSGERGPRRDIVLVNAAVGLVAAGFAADFQTAMEAAADSIDSGRACAKLQALQEAFPLDPRS